MTDPKATWLPNLVGGISIWKLAQDLNAERLFDGRLLVPETEGSDSLPVKVTWDLKDVLPLAEARAAHGEDVEQGIKDFAACLERVAEEFADEKSGYHKFKDALTMPGGFDKGSYFFDPKSKKVLVINWGASPRSIAGQEVRVFGWVDWAAMAASAAVAPQMKIIEKKSAEKPDEKSDEKKKTDDKKEEEKKKEEAPPVLLWGRPIWQWALAALLALVIALVVVFLLKPCDKGGTTVGGADGSLVDGAGLPDGQTMLADGAVVLPDGAVVSADASLDAKATDASSDGSSDAASDAGDGGKAKDGGKDGGKIGVNDDEDEGTIVVGGGGPGGGGVIFMGPGPGGGPKRPLPHRTDYHPDAVRWRVAEGAELLHSGSPTEGNGTSFNVTLKHGTSFDGVRTEWQDKAGNWHSF